MYKKKCLYTEYLWPRNQKLAVLNDCIYKNLALILTRELNRVELFNGSVFYEEGEYLVKLRATLLVYRTGACTPGRAAPRITDIVPVWYECEVTENGNVIANEFSWKEFREFLP